MNVSKEIRFRVYITFLAMSLFGLLIFYKGAMIQIREGKALQQLAQEQHTRIDTLEPERGNIYTEDGCLLSTSIPVFDIHIDFSTIKKDTFNKYVESMSKQVAAVLKDSNCSWYEYKSKFVTAFHDTNRYFLLKRKASYAQYLDLRKIQPFCKGPNKGGFIAESQTQRIRPYDTLAYRVVGLIKRKNASASGIEGDYDQELRGSQGQRVMRVIAGGAWMPVDGSEIDPENGRDVITTIDLNMQDAVEQALLKQLKKEDASYGTCIVMEVKTGKIKAIANLGRDTVNKGNYFEDLNYALRRYEPGSTFKLISLISLLKDKKIGLEDMINCEGGHTDFGNGVKIDDSHSGLGMLTVRDAFAHSSNVAFAKLIYHNYKNDIHTYWNNLHDLHLDQLTGLGLSGELKPRITHDSARSGKHSLPYMGMGYLVYITPLHMCMVYNSIANNGKMMKPYLVNSIQEYGRNTKTFEPTIVNEEVLDTATITKLKATMEEVVLTGTGKALKNNYYSICGKTGTAQVADRGIKYSDHVYHGSFIGFFPKEDPQYTICVVLRTKKGSSNYYGGAIALPVFKEVANRLYALNMHNANTAVHLQKAQNKVNLYNLNASNFNIINEKLGLSGQRAPGQGWVVDCRHDSSGHMNYQTMQVLGDQVPNVNGMGLREALYLLEKSGLKVHPQGRGRVMAQSIEPGSPITKGQIITLQLG